MPFVMRFLVIVLLVLVGWSGQAHEVRPGYLEISETADDQYDVTWKQPIKDGRRLRIDPIFPETCERQSETVRRVPGSVVLSWTTECPLEGQTISVSGLDRTLTDVVVRISRIEAGTTTNVLRAGRASVIVEDGPAGAALRAYLQIGVEHIVFGYDHLLFVIAIVLLVRPRQLLGTITAFTIAHSLTLGLAMTTTLSVPSRIVEITIALSIALLAVEIVQKQRGAETLASRRPWLIAFAFGLIHGLGFAGALSDIGLPEEARLWALALFNIGVELGQLAVVGIALLVIWMVAPRLPDLRSPAVYVSAYTIGTIGMFWALERALIVSGA